MPPTSVSLPRPHPALRHPAPPGPNLHPEPQGTRGRTHTAPLRRDPAGSPLLPTAAPSVPQPACGDTGRAVTYAPSGRTEAGPVSEPGPGLARGTREQSRGRGRVTQARESLASAQALPCSVLALSGPRQAAPRLPCRLCRGPCSGPDGIPARGGHLPPGPGVGSPPGGPKLPRCFRATCRLCRQQIWESLENRDRDCVTDSSRSEFLLV